MVDLHFHLLPGLDDGPGDSVASVALADEAARLGVTTVVATPHLRPDYPAVRVEELGERTAAIAEIVRGHGIPLEVLPGAELSWHAIPGLDDEALRCATLAGNGSDLLLETPWEPFGTEFERAVGALLARGFRVTLAHPERSLTMQRNPPALERLLDMGVLVQITASSLLGSRRSPARRFALLALEHGWAHVLASDAHAVAWRPPDLAEGVAAARRAFPERGREFEWMASDAPRAITRGQPLPPRPAPAERPPKGLGGLLRRG
jgi:protein-tyrosine phosphatase